jgi:hypothetical protein
MSTMFVPELGTKTIPTPTADQVITNLPPRDTPVKATLGETVVYGKIDRASDSLPLFYINIDGGHEGFLQLPIWLRVGWDIEVLDAADVAA